MPPPRALVVGEALVDEYPDRRVPAGAPLHVAAHLAARGWETHLATRLGADDDGRALRAVLAAHGIRADLVETDPVLLTGTVAIGFDEGGEPRYTIRRPAAWDAFEGPAEAPAHDALSYGSLAARDPRARTAWARLLGASKAPWRVFDVNLRPPDVDPWVLHHGLRRATLVKMSAGEMEEVARLLGLAPEPEAYFEAASALRYLCVTRGGKGAALLDGLARGWPEGEALVGAVRAAAAVLGQRGALPRQNDGAFGEHGAWG